MGAGLPASAGIKNEELRPTDLRIDSQIKTLKVGLFLMLFFIRSALGRCVYKIKLNKEIKIMVKSVFLGRCSPLTIGHEYIINQMLTNHGDNSLIILGSKNVPVSPENIFSFIQRFFFVRTIFPYTEIATIPDYNDNERWLNHLDQILNQYGSSLDRALFYIGSESDASFFIEAGIKTKVVDRHKGEAPRVSATQVRDYLYNGKDITGMVNPEIQENIISCFNKNLSTYLK